MRVVPILGPHFAGKTTLWRSLVGLPAPPARVVEEEVRGLPYLEKLSDRVMNCFTVTNRGVYYYRTRKRGVVFPVGLWDGGVSHPDDLSYHIANMLEHGPVLIDGPTRNLPPLMISHPDLFDWPIVVTLEPPMETLIERANSRREAGLGRNANPERTKRQPSRLAREGMIHWQGVRDRLERAGFQLLNVEGMSRAAAAELVSEALLLGEREA